MSAVKSVIGNNAGPLCADNAGIRLQSRYPLCNLAPDYFTTFGSQPTYVCSVGFIPHPPIPPQLLNGLLFSDTFNQDPIGGNHDTGPVYSIATMDKDRPGLLTDNREKMSDMIIHSCRGQNRERLPVAYTEISDLVVAGVREGDVAKVGLVIQDQLKVHNCSHTVLNQPRGAVFAGPGAAPKDIRSYHAEVLNSRTEVVPARAGGALHLYRGTTAHEGQNQERDGEATPVRGSERAHDCLYCIDAPPGLQIQIHFP